MNGSGPEKRGGIMHDDQTMMRISQDARLQFDNTTAAWEGFVAAL